MRWERGTESKNVNGAMRESTSQSKGCQGSEREKTV